MKKERKIFILIYNFLKKNIINILSILILIVYVLIPANQYDRVIFIDVGQGDATLIQIRDQNILIDGGPDDSVVFKLSKYLKPWDRKLDLVILTHPHGDHIEGVNDILRHFAVGHLMVFPVCYGRPDWIDLLDQEEIVFGYAGQVFDLYDFRFHILWPELNLDELNENECVSKFNGNVNDDSIVFVMEDLSKGVKYLFTGDAEIEVEELLLEYEVLKNINVTQAGHHCSNTSNSWNFLTYTSPDLVICSVGEGNKFGHPGKETLQRLGDLGVYYLRTDFEGDIELRL